MQKRVVKKIKEQVGKGRRISVSRAMRESGYAPGFAKNPQRLKEQKGFQEEIAKIRKDFDPDMIKGIHTKLLNAYSFRKVACGNMKEEEARAYVAELGYKVVSSHRTFGVTYVTIEVPDHQHIKTGIDFVYKLSGAYAPEKYEDVNPYKDLSDDELEEQRKELEAVNRYKKEAKKVKKAK